MPANPEQPFVTIILPVRNEAAYIRRSLVAVLAQDYPCKRFEVLVADGMSGDLTREIVSELIRGNPQISARLIDNPGAIVPKALNIAISQARGDVLVRVDGHCEIAADYISRCVQYLRSADISAAGGPIETVADTHVAEAISVAMSSPFGVGGVAFRTVGDRDTFVDTVAFPAYSRKVLEKVGLFDEELACNEDDEYNYRLREMGGRILLAPDIHSRYYVRGSLAKLWKQYFRYGLWKIRVLQKHPRQMQFRQFVPPLFVLVLGGSGLLVMCSAFGWLVPALYVLANLSASMLTARKRGWRYLPPLPLVFAILHVSYGLGFLVGLVKFADRWGDRVGKVPAWSPAKS